MSKIGEGHAAAMARAGLKEIAQALPAFPAQGIQPVEEPGLVGNPTQQIVTDQMEYVPESTITRGDEGIDRGMEMGD